MAKHLLAWNQSCYEQRIKCGRGSGEGSAYQPWLRVQDFSSRGTISRVQGWKTGRVHHFMSNHELLYFFLLEWADAVVDIREQYPLLDVSTTLEIAKDAGIAHPYDHRSGFPYVLTSDFLITTIKGYMVRTVKMSHELDNRRVLEKLEIERRYWNEKGVDWRLVTEREINRQKAKNIEWLHSSKTLRGLSHGNAMLDEMLLEIERLYWETENTILDICEHIEASFSADCGTGLALFKHLAANKRLPFDVDRPAALSKRRGMDSAVCPIWEKVAV